MRSFEKFFRALGVPLVLLLLSIAAYGLLIPYLGFYWDDWPMVWFAHRLGPAGYDEVFSSDRPFLAGVYLLTTSLLKTVPLQWQILGIFSRWLTSLALWWTLRRLWQRSGEQIAWIAILFTVYPGFKQQPISVVYGNGFLLLFAFLLSFGLMLQALRNPSRYWLWTAGGILTYAVCMFSTEYYVGLDLFRPILIWLVLSESVGKRRLRLFQTLRHWAPYLLVLLAFLVWRVFIFKFPTYQPGLVEGFADTPTATGVHLLVRVIQDVFTTGWLAWSSTFRFPHPADFSLLSDTLYWVVVGLSLPLVWFYLVKFRRGEQDLPPASPEIHSHWALQAMALGAAALVLGGVPFWITELPITLDFPWDRFSLALMLGSAIFFVGLLSWALRTRLQLVFILGLMISMAIGSHFHNANSYRRDWLTQKDFFWQLVWRAPGLEPGTILLTHKLPLVYYSDNSLTAPLNWIYAPDDHTYTMSYFLAFTQVRLGRSIPDLKPGLPVQQGYRSAQFVGNTSNALVVFYSPPGCLRLLDPAREGDLPIFPAEIERAMVISQPGQVILDPAQPAQPPLEIFGSTPPPNWCYYFQKADLARQLGNWQQVAAIGNQEFQAGFFPAEASELVLFIEAYAFTGDWDQAMDLAQRSYALSHNMQSKLCNTINKLRQEYLSPSEAPQSVHLTLRALECPSR
ncbi:MAG: hypothetical protein U1B80_04535 [Anaerolineaceae bacterium]|nr:hypothetical protein [Anaerolineaceae bacterium]